MSDGIQVFLSSDRFLDSPIFFQLVRLKDSFFLWIGSQTPELKALDVATKSPFSAVPNCTSVMGASATDDVFSVGFARRLAARTGQMVYLSYNLPRNREHLEAFVQRKAMSLLKAKGLVSAAPGGVERVGSARTEAKNAVVSRSEQQSQPQDAKARPVTEGAGAKDTDQKTA